MPRTFTPHDQLPTSIASDVARRTELLMGTFVTIQVVGDDDVPRRLVGIDRAFEWFRRVEACCNRFDPGSEIRRLTTAIGTAVPVSGMLFEVVRVALAVAEETGGAFDPTVGLDMEARGFDRDYRTGRVARSGLDVERSSGASYRDVRLDAGRRTVTIARPLLLDLGASAKGLAVDMAARELEMFEHYAIDAGGDLFLAGRSGTGSAWSVGIRHPRIEGSLIDVVEISDRAVCTSGDYERRTETGHSHHIIDPRTGTEASSAISATVIAHTAVLADALATAALVLGPVDGIRLLDHHGLAGLIVSPTLELHRTRAYPR